MRKGSFARYLIGSLLLVFVIQSPLVAVDYYVAPLSSNPVGKNGDGTQAKPFYTLEQARDAIRASKAQRTGITTVYLRGGLYELISFSLTAQDSGTRSAPIIYKAMNGETPRLTGAVKLDNSTFVRLDVNGSIGKRLPNPSLVWEYRLADNYNPGDIMTWNNDGGNPTVSRAEIFMDGSRLNLSRYPNAGELSWPPDLTIPNTWSNPQSSDIWVKGASGWVWRGVHYRAIFPLSQTVYDETTGKGLPDFGFYFYNALEALDSAGEYYFDIYSGATRKLYLIPSNTSITSIGASREFLLSQIVNPIISIQKASFVSFSRITIEATRGDGISIDGGDHNAISGCKIINIGRNGIVVQGQPLNNDSYNIDGYNHTISDCTITDIGADSIYMNGGNMRTGGHSGHVVTGCEIARPGRHTAKANSRAFKCTGVGHVFSHNNVHDSVDIGVSIGGYHNIYECNDLYDLAQQKNDTAALYGMSQPTWGTLGNIIRHNYIHDLTGVSGQFIAGIYADCDSTAGFVVGNMLVNIGKSQGNGLGIEINGGRNNNIYGNVIVGLARAIGVNQGSNQPVDSNGNAVGWMTESYFSLVFPNRQIDPLFIKYPHSDEPGIIPQANWNAVLTLPKYNTVNNNAFVACSNTKISEDNVTAYVAQTGNKIYATIDAVKFVNSAGGDYSLQPGSPIFADIPSFRNIPFGTIGNKVPRVNKLYIHHTFGRMI